MRGRRRRRRRRGKRRRGRRRRRRRGRRRRREGEGNNEENVEGKGALEFTEERLIETNEYTFNTSNRKTPRHRSRCNVTTFHSRRRPTKADLHQIDVIKRTKTLIH